MLRATGCIQVTGFDPNAVARLCAEVSAFGFTVIPGDVESDQSEIVLCDMDGHEESLGDPSRATGSGLRSVLISSHYDVDVVRRYFPNPPLGFLLKPYQPEQLHATLDVALKYHSSVCQRCRTSQRFQGMVTTIEDGLYSVEAATEEYRYVSPGFERLLGFTLDDVARMGGRREFLRTIIQAGRFSEHEAWLQRLKREVVQESFLLEAWWRRRDGTMVYIEDRCRPIYENGRLQAVNGVLRDITARRTMEEALQQERVLLRTVIDNLPHAVYAKDMELRKTLANRADVKLSGRSAESEVLGKTDFDLYSEEQATLFSAADMNVLRTGEAVVDREEYFLDADGSKRYLLTTKLPLHDQQGRVTGLVGIGRDITERKKAEESLRLFRSLVDRSSDAIYVLDPYSGRILDANEAAWKNLGRTREELLQLNVFDIDPIIPRDIRDRLLPELERNGPTLLISEHVRKDGTRFPVEVGVSNVHLERDYVLTSARDITRRRQVEEVLRESEKRFSNIIQFIPLPTMVVDPAGKVAAWNAAMEKFTGVVSTEILGKGDYAYGMLFHGARRPILADFAMHPELPLPPAYTNVLRNGDNLVAETYLPAVKGGKAYVLATATALRDTKGQVIGAIESLLDLSARKQVEVALQASEERFRLISENMADLITVIDGEGVCLYASPSYRQEGLDPDQLSGQNFLAFVHPEDGREFQRRVDLVLNEHRHQSMEFRFRRQDGSWRVKDATMSLLVNDVGVRVVSVMRDVTERIQQEAERLSLQTELRQRNEELERTLEKSRQMQQGLVQAEKMASIGQLTAGIAHEINNPLAFVSSNLNRFKEYFDELQRILRVWDEARAELEGDDRYVRRLQAVMEVERAVDREFIVTDFATLMGHTRDGAERIRSIVERLRGFTHLADTSFAPADLNTAVEDTLTLTWNELKYKATIKREYGPIPPVTCNAGEIKQVLVNLLVNAAQAIKEKGTITVRTRHAGDNVVVEVEDTGSGISPVHLKRVFDPFFTTKPVGKGTGLGLWISATLIQKHHGALTARSEEGKGTVMTIELPIEQPGQEGEVA